jgi:hypothetical protein
MKNESAGKWLAMSGTKKPRDAGAVSFRTSSTGPVRN